MSYRDWYVGMKVVCVDDEYSPLAETVRKMGCRLPERGRVYTIDQIGPRDGRIVIRLVELDNPRVKVPGYKKGPPVFAARRFRPVQTRKTDISIFTAMLHGTDQKADA